MTREQLEHVLRAAGAVADVAELIVIGSQAILATATSLPTELLISVEADVFPLHHPERANLIDGSIGELSPFHQTFGYYAHGVGPETAVLPEDWTDRLVPLRNDNTAGVTGWCLHATDLVLSKLAAGRDKDLRYCRLLVQALNLDLAQLQALAMKLPQDYSGLVLQRLARIAAVPAPGPLAQ